MFNSWVDLKGLLPEHFFDFSQPLLAGKVDPEGNLTLDTYDFHGAHADLIQYSVQFRSVTQSCLTLQPHELQHARSPCPSPAPRVHPNSCPLSRWCHLTISSSVAPFSSCLQSLPATESVTHAFNLVSLGALLVEEPIITLKSGLSQALNDQINEWMNECRNMLLHISVALLQC